MLSLKMFTLWKKRKQHKDSEDTIWLQKPLEYYQATPLSPIIRLPARVANVFTLQEMRKATNDFCYSRLLGEGGFGRVYRGILSMGQVVAIKQMDPALSSSAQGEREFRVEVDILSRLNHPNLVNLIGYCADKGHRILVYEFMPQGNLQEHLHGIVRVRMDWCTRVGVAVGVAKALKYLHTGPATGNPVIHRDLKSSNILLDENFQPKVSDFGLAKLVPFGSNTYVSTRVLGTFGYFDPQYTATGHLTVKCDVYAFGVVLLELLTGRRPVDATQSLRKQNLVSLARECLKEKRKLKKILDPDLSAESCSWGSIKKFATLAWNCVREDDNRRPTMTECVKQLEQLYVFCSSSQQKYPMMKSSEQIFY
ncbi:hypothetical protein O6H91_05G045700 [Diphasiastrum complanatum]|uniref:Uncharacterized protein n=5 Tax=Diphasiastrum complanatum TaxID=34168 RepID=A0ACC2DMS8_DIPCM|nr:hypothetical protein O6H91_05G045700 [Diphasiastrum complanatum]KAJ7555581.1 hypothetical protein O6H91_05G045700 [Diphasiastrum complanatum]KAJ7555582.1 hypothetical protein O6H91_05G045700 [Diphasiastrum complanatum]KAJ7555583.1 hypothetical protein O6H91_05G045700 [Diphasiastrum complanatum]KAJ7555584.1 hypothetical protein O6H91_05G045700 [Diphasiastrum complanatum]